MKRTRISVLSMLVAGSLVGLALAASPATATHDRPAHATSISVDLVPAHRKTISEFQCEARGGTNSTHGPPLSFASCNPPAFLPGVQAHTGSSGESSADVTVLEGDGDPSNGDTADVTLQGTGTDVRLGSASGPDYNPVAAPGAQDMTGVSRIRISDHFNTTPGQACSPNCPATMIDFDFTAPVACAPTASTSVGSTCSVNTSADGVIPDVVKEAKEAVVMVNRIRIKDAGSDNVPGNANDRDAFMQGIFIP